MLGKSKNFLSQEENILSKKDDSGMSGLHYACLMGNNKVATKILEKMNPTQINEENEEGNEQQARV